MGEYQKLDKQDDILKQPYLGSASVNKYQERSAEYDCDDGSDCDSCDSCNCNVCDYDMS